MRSMVVGTLLLLAVYSSAAGDCAKGREFVHVVRPPVAVAESIFLEEFRNILRRGDTLIVRTAGEDVVLVDNRSNSDAAIHYRVVGYFEVSENRTDYLVFAQAWEGSAYRLINGQTGKWTRLDGEPVISPGGDRYVASSCDLEGIFNHNSLTVVSVADFSIECRFTYYNPRVFSEPENYECTCPTSPAWLDDSRIVFLVSTPVTIDHISRMISTPFLLEYRDAKWERIPLLK